MIRLCSIEDDDREWIRSFIQAHWSGENVVVHGKVYSPHLLPGFIAEDERGTRVGLATYAIEGSSCELVTLDSVREGKGIGTALVNAVAGECEKRGCSRLWCVTTNDNHHALEFYTKRGFRVVAVHQGAVERSRAIKPTIPLIGFEGISIMDEIELERQVGTPTQA